jgi:hypothetical protein
VAGRAGVVLLGYAAAVAFIIPIFAIVAVDRLRRRWERW